MMMHTTNKSSPSFLLILALLVIAVSKNYYISVRAFHQRFPTTRTTTQRCSHADFRSSCRSSRSFLSSSSSSSDNNDDGNNSKDDEIAKLEEQLKKLKEGKSTVVAPSGEEKIEESASIAPPSPLRTDDADADEEVLEEASMDMFLSEGWKEAKSNYDPSNTATNKRQADEQGSLIGTVVKVVGGILAVVLFSQIPVGQEDLSKYSAIKSGPAVTTVDLGDTNRVKGQVGSSDL